MTPPRSGFKRTSPPPTPCAPPYTYSPRDWSHHLRHTFGGLGVAPEELSGLRINTDYALAQKLHVLFSPARLDDDCRCITGGITTGHRRFPNDGTGFLVQG